MTGVLTDMVNRITPYMQYQFMRWRSDGGSLRLWQEQLQKTFDFLEKRTPSFLSEMGNVLAVYCERLVINAEHAAVTVSCDDGQVYTVKNGSESCYIRDGRLLTLTVVPDEGYTCNSVRYKIGPKEYTSEDLTLSFEVIARTTVTVETVPSGG